MSDIIGGSNLPHIWGKSYGSVLPKSGQTNPYRGGATLMKVPKICGRLEGGLMSDIRRGYNVGH